MKHAHPGLPGTWPCAHVLLDTALLITDLDAAAHALLNQAQGVLRVARRRLVAPGTQAELDRCLAQAAAGEPAALLIERPGQWPFTLRCTPVVAAPPWGPGVLVSLRDPLAEQADQAWLQRLFGLTAAEADITAALAMGQPGSLIAQDRGVQPNTVRAHLKKVLAKTGTSHQVALVSLVLRSAAMVGTLSQAPSPFAPTPLDKGGD